MFPFYRSFNIYIYIIRSSNIRSMDKPINIIPINFSFFILSSFNNSHYIHNFNTNINKNFRLFIFPYFNNIRPLPRISPLHISHINNTKNIINILYLTRISQFITVICTPFNYMHIWYNQRLNYKNNKNKFKISGI